MILCLIVILFSLVEATPAILNQDLVILQQLYNDTSGSQWTRADNWTAISVLAPCDWYGVTCFSDNQSVSELVLSGNMLQGTIPSILIGLMNLTRLDLSSNNLVGAIPDMSSVTTLEYLSLKSNQLSSLSGPLPTSLRTLDLSENALGPDIPVPLRNWTSYPLLETTSLAQNGFCGIFPFDFQISPIALYTNFGSNSFFCPLPEINTVLAQCLNFTISRVFPVALPVMATYSGQIMMTGSNIATYSNCGNYQFSICINPTPQQRTKSLRDRREGEGEGDPGCMMTKFCVVAGEDDAAIICRLSAWPRAAYTNISLLISSPSATLTLNTRLPEIYFYEQPNVTQIHPNAAYSGQLVTLTGGNFPQPSAMGMAEKDLLCRFTCVNHTEKSVKYSAADVGEEEHHERLTTIGVYIDKTQVHCPVPDMGLTGIFLSLEIAFNGQDYVTVSRRIYFEENSASNKTLILALSVGITGALIIISAVLFFVRRSRRGDSYKYSQINTLGSVFDETREIMEWEIDSKHIVLERRLDVGSMGAVWKGKWRHTSVAVKKFSAHTVSDVTTFKKECSMLSRLHHPNVLRFFGISHEKDRQGEGSFLLVTEYMSMGSLYNVLHNSAIGLDLFTRLSMALDAAKGMAYLHSHNPCVLHRDLKSPNLLIDDQFVLKVADFGIARAGSNDLMTFCGTPKWTAPEVLRLNRYSEKADVYSFGICLWELLTRKEPFEDVQGMQVVVMLINEGARPPIPADAPEDFATLIQECWEERPGERPSFEEVFGRLSEIRNQLSSTPRTVAAAPHLTIQ